MCFEEFLHDQRELQIKFHLRELEGKYKKSFLVTEPPVH